MEVAIDNARVGAEEVSSAKKKKTIIILGLLLLLLLAAVAMLILLLLPKAPAKKGSFGFLFSIYGLNQPRGVSVDSKGNIYVSDTGGARVLVFDNQGVYKKRIGGAQGHTRVYAAYSTYIDEKAHKVFIADVTARVLHVFSDKGKFLYRFPKRPNQGFGPAGFSPFGIAEYRGKLFVASNNGIYVFTKKGKLIRSLSGRGQKSKEFNFPNGLAIDGKDGTIYVSDGLNKRVKAISQNGAVKWVLGKPDEHGYIKSFFAMPRGLAIDSQYVYIADAMDSKIVVLRKDGGLVSLIGKRGVDDGQFNFPEGVAVKDGKFYVADRENNRVQVLRVDDMPKPEKDDLKKYSKTFTKIAK